MGDYLRDQYANKVNKSEPVREVKLHFHRPYTSPFDTDTKNYINVLTKEIKNLKEENNSLTDIDYIQ